MAMCSPSWSRGTSGSLRPSSRGPSKGAIGELKQLLCDAGEGGTCLNTVPGTDLNAYHDNFHLNTGGSIYLWPHLCDAMESIGLM